MKYQFIMFICTHIGIPYMINIEKNENCDDIIWFIFVPTYIFILYMNYVIIDQNTNHRHFNHILSASIQRVF